MVIVDHFLKRDDWLIQSTLKPVSNQSLCDNLRDSSPTSSGEGRKTDPMDNTDCTRVELKSSLIKTEETEESIERKNGFGMGREEELILSNIKEEEERDGEGQREDGVTVDVIEFNNWSPESEEDGQREADVMDQTQQSDMMSDLKQEEDSMSSLVTSFVIGQSTVPSAGSPVICPREVKTEMEPEIPTPATSRVIKRRKRGRPIAERRQEEIQKKKILNATRVHLGPAFIRWRRLKEMKGLKTDALVAEFLLDSYDSVAPLSTPIQGKDPPH